MIGRKAVTGLALLSALLVCAFVGAERIGSRSSQHNSSYMRQRGRRQRFQRRPLR